MGGKQTQFESAKTETRGGEGIPPGVLGKDVSPCAQNRTQKVIVRFHPASSAFAQAAFRNCPGSLGLPLAHAGHGNTRVGDNAQGSPSHGGGDQCGNGHDGQKLNGCAHVIYRKPPLRIVAEFPGRRDKKYITFILD